MPWLTETEDGVLLSLVVQPRAGKTVVQGKHGGALKIRLAAPPVDGAANEELVSFLAKLLGVRRDAVAIVRGPGSRHKVVAVRGVTSSEVRGKLTGEI